jgi:hypothetical protein
MTTESGNLIRIKFDLSQICAASMIADPPKVTIALVAAGRWPRSSALRYLTHVREMTGGRILKSLWRSQMSALAKRAVRVVAEAKEPDVLVHVRFHPNADIAKIDKQPQHLTPHQWYTRLCQGASSHYLGLAGGRGFFRIPQSTFDAILTKG